MTRKTDEPSPHPPKKKKLFYFDILLKASFKNSRFSLKINKAIHKINIRMWGHLSTKSPQI